MANQQVTAAPLVDVSSRHPKSRPLFRTPRKRDENSYIAFVGGTATYGKYIERPFPVLIEKELDQNCINLGRVNGGLDVFLSEEASINLCRKAALTVVQLTSTHLLSNRFYTVDPRRNDQFHKASSVLEAVYPDVDFEDFTSTRDMLARLFATSSERFETVVKELQAAWHARMQNLLHQIGHQVVLLWFSETPLNNNHWSEHPDKLDADPLFVTRDMVEQLRHLVQNIIVVQPSEAALAEGVRGMHFPSSQASAAREMLGVQSHREAATKLAPFLKAQLEAE